MPAGALASCPATFLPLALLSCIATGIEVKRSVVEQAHVRRYMLLLLLEFVRSRASIRPIAEGATQRLQELVPVGQRKNNFERQIEVSQQSGDSRPYPLYGRHGTM